MKRQRQNLVDATQKTASILPARPITVQSGDTALTARKTPRGVLPNFVWLSKLPSPVNKMSLAVAFLLKVSQSDRKLDSWS